MLEALLLAPAFGLIAALLAFAMNWVALTGWRRSANQHWTEQARLFHPVRVAAIANTWTIPAALTSGFVLLWPENPTPWSLVAFAAALGTTIGTVPMDREVFARIPLKSLWRQAAFTWSLRIGIVLAFLAAMTAMPNDFGWEVAAIFVLTVASYVVWVHSGIIWFGRATGLFAPATDRLQKLAEETASKMNIHFREVLIVRISTAQAFALPGSRRLLFTDRLLELCSDEEVAAICAHELAHLGESKAVRLMRFLRSLVFVPLLLLKPLMNSFGAIPVVALTLIMVLVPRLWLKISRKLEARADQIAKVNESESGSYARALEKVYQDGLVPAVMAPRRQTHPNLYDRMLAAGLTPGFPRPAAAKGIALHGQIVALGAGVLLGFLLVRMTDPATYVVSPP